MQTFRSVVRPTAVAMSALLLTASVAPQVSAAPYKSPNGYTVTPPAGWTTSHGTPGTEVVFMSRTRENINVVTQAVPKGTSLEAARTQTIALLKRMMTNYKVLGQGNSTLGGQRAAVLVSGYTLSQPPIKLRAYQSFTIRNGKLYVFTCTARESSYAKFNGAFMRTLSSVRWTK